MRALGKIKQEFEALQGFQAGARMEKEWNESPGMLSFGIASDVDNKTNKK